MGQSFCQETSADEATVSTLLMRLQLSHCEQPWPTPDCCFLAISSVLLLGTKDWVRCPVHCLPWLHALASKNHTPILDLLFTIFSLSFQNPKATNHSRLTGTIVQMGTLRNQSEYIWDHKMEPRSLIWT